MWKNKPKLLIIDGRNLLWRTSDAFSDLFIVKNDVHIPTGGIYGFLSNLIKIYQRHGGKVVVAWEGKKNFRYKLYPEYKQRPKVEWYDELLEEINDQQRRLKSILRLMGVEQYKAIGCEADDVMATLAASWTRSGENQAIIYTADSDLRQCVDGYTFVVSPQPKGKEIIYAVNDVKEKDGVYPKYIPDLKALAGDVSDNIPGIKSVGNVTAQKLVGSFGTVKNVIKAAKDKNGEWPVTDRFRGLVLENKKQIKLYKKITTVLFDAKMRKIKPKRTQKQLRTHLAYYKFRSLMSSNEIFELMNMGKDEKDQ